MSEKTKEQQRGHDLEGVMKALSSAEKKHPNWPSSQFEQLSILTEEVGEVAKALNDGNEEEAVKELYQVGAMVFRMLQNIDNPF